MLDFLKSLKILCLCSLCLYAETPSSDISFADHFDISANPGAVNISTGTGALGRRLGIKDTSGVRLGGVWIGNTDFLCNGGIKKAKTVSANSLLILSLSLDMEKICSWKGGSFGSEFLQFNGMNANVYAGSIQGYDGLVALPPLNRSELYQLWFRQALFNEKLILRIGKTVPITDFNNVLRPLLFEEDAMNIPAVSGLIYTPIYTNSSMIGVLPGYYNSAYGVIAILAPTKNYYCSVAAYDGNLARGVQTGLKGPHFNGYYFYIGEMGYAWQIGKYKKPGIFAAGIWDQTGKLKIPGTQESGTQGLYAFGSQRLWFKNPGKDNSGLMGFFQLGINRSKTLPMQKYLGLGMTAFALTRPKDSLGVGMAWAWLNPRLFQRQSELMLQTYYQLHLMQATFLQPTITFIPMPGASKDLPPTWTATLQIISLF